MKCKVASERLFKEAHRADIFWERVDKSGDCWLWLACRSEQGYGFFDFNGKRYVATRVAYELHHGVPLPADKFACHTCDNPPCVRPDHLFPGTAKENFDDFIAKGFSCSATPKTTDQQVREIVERYRQGGVTQLELAIEYGISRSQVSNYIRGTRRRTAIT
jgi:hypothetical protein